MITLDTSGIVALFVRKDQRYREAVRALEAARMPTVVPVGILAEVDEVLGRRLAPTASLAFLEGIQTGETLLDHGDLDLPRITTLMSRYAALPLGFATRPSWLAPSGTEGSCSRSIATGSRRSPATSPSR